MRDAARHLAGIGADPVLDERAKSAYRRRLDALAEQIDDARRPGEQRAS